MIAPDERLPWGQTVALGIQHVFAMFGAPVLVPILMGFDPNTAIFFSGIGTLLFFFVVGGRVPSYLGSSFSFVAVVLTATAYQAPGPNAHIRSEEHTSELQSRQYLVCRLLLEKKKNKNIRT